MWGCLFETPERVPLKQSSPSQRCVGIAETGRDAELAHTDSLLSDSRRAPHKGDPRCRLHLADHACEPSHTEPLLSSSCPVPCKGYPSCWLHSDNKPCERAHTEPLLSSSRRLPDKGYVPKLLVAFSYITSTRDAWRNGGQPRYPKPFPNHPQTIPKPHQGALSQEGSGTPRSAKILCTSACVSHTLSESLCSNIVTLLPYPSWLRQFCSDSQIALQFCSED
jgi:hypothetical protein